MQEILFTAGALGRMQRISHSSQVICKCSQQFGATESNCLAVQTEHTTFAHDNQSAVHTLTTVVTLKTAYYE